MWVSDAGSSIHCAHRLGFMRLGIRVYGQWFRDDAIWDSFVRPCSIFDASTKPRPQTLNPQPSTLNPKP